MFASVIGVGTCQCKVTFQETMIVRIIAISIDEAHMHSLHPDLAGIPSAQKKVQDGKNVFLYLFNFM